MSVTERARKPVLGFAAFSGCGKTTLLKAILPLLEERGLRVAMIKHAHHDFDIDHPGKDSFELRKAGARQMLVASNRREALITERPCAEEPRLAQLVGRLDQDMVDLILVEGFKKTDFPKIELHRPELGKPLLFPGDNSIIALATDTEAGIVTRLPVLDLNAPGQVADFICRFAGRSSQ